MLKYAVSEDGALHAEKFYRTCSTNLRARGGIPAGGMWWRWRG